MYFCVSTYFSIGFFFAIHSVNTRALKRLRQMRHPTLKDEAELPHVVHGPHAQMHVDQVHLSVYGCRAFDSLSVDQVLVGRRNLKDHFLHEFLCFWGFWNVLRVQFSLVVSLVLMDLCAPLLLHYETFVPT